VAEPVVPEQLVLAGAATVAAAFERVKAGGRGLAVVLDDEGRVAGTLTDGALRRAALSSPSLDVPVTGVLSRRPVVADVGDGDEDVRSLLAAHRLPAIPVVEDGRLVGVRSADEFDGLRGPAASAVVMVGGRGKRLRPLTDKVPKPLLRIGGGTIVERIIRNLGAAGVVDVYLAVNYMAAMFEERLGDGAQLGVRLHYVREEEALGTAGALTLLHEPPAGPLLVTNGDLVTNLDYRALFDFHWHHGGAITVASVDHHTSVPYGVLRTAEDHLLAIDEKPTRRDLVNAGIYVLQPEVLRYLPRGTEVGMPDLIADVVADGLSVHVFPVLEPWSDIGTPEEFERVLLAFATGEEE
jgi:dTDP-glucose pyrophosphorylase